MGKKSKNTKPLGKQWDVLFASSQRSVICLEWGGFLFTVGDRIKAVPLMINERDGAMRLKRLPVTQKLIDEYWLQKLIQDHPSILPVSEIEPVFGPLVCIGKEVPTKDGFIDNLFISPQGYLTIVETKLWRNPEARREVVGQIIDYAKEINTWSFEKLDSSVKAYHKSNSGRELGVIDALRLIEDIDEEREKEIIDEITRHIQRGRFLLLIVGDGIRENVEAMADFLSKTPQLHFTLALVELQIYKMDEGKLVIPQIVMRTREITRAVIRIEGGTVHHLTVGVDVEPGKEVNRRSRRTLSAQDFFEELSKYIKPEEVLFAQQIIDDMEELGCKIEWKSASFAVKIEDPTGSGQMLTLLLVSKRGEVYIGWLPDQLEKIELPRKIGEEYYEKIRQLLSGCEISLGKPDVWEIGKIKERYDLLKQLLIDVIKEIRLATE